ncbi:MAG TPA: CBS domain-containing protein [Candidatus Binataceae bacterium]|nr:CBS domain-containing protein [Candidatus Binataceae bacterium]
MTKDPVVVESKESLAAVRRIMDEGHFRRVPVVDGGALVGIVSDRDLRQHTATLARVKVNGAMTAPVLSVTPTTLLEEAANLLVKHKVGALPVVDRGKLVGIITATDLLRAFAEVLGSTEEGVARIDLSFEGDSSELATIVQLVAQENGEILGMGTYRGDPTEGGGKVFYLRLRAADAHRVAQMLTDKNFTVLTIHP